MKTTMPVGELVKLMDRGVITVPTKYRKKLNLKKGELLNIFDWEGLLIVSPVDITPQTMPYRIADKPDWTKDSPSQYLKKVRYNKLEKLWAKRTQEGW
ncbi:MAG: hypothetical protein UU81_C0010G0008 [Microgenomates group bacterium GW2011_GWC1_41_8]|uniref:SpoVT-AbrB domain-containing protein n=3 Tax=Candidatus Roizmaniibacteriota TaxID=1752723 RepID=A0A0G0ZHF3_9BACT|nr:MAG: hypothetical protein UU14_C0003G0026 [Candidatus Roizmanbacteria bacterium GW2011_GWB1_40_7]KKR91627.1 MAG: hypothetical protein UU41_C0034G0011 [Candidatus Roizmanbacteria bacterium GW2011_GWA1_41_13]KKS21496.1 MAG: hypothetical protein UU78_C0037G0007 [Candidatus Roizmanbacteria bacterium GW2011_GWC2_41_7]KKS24225.1 MAG: hypothetical protein UU81_C0010G0008 [Microgenomates group bacterium GW2011_GWC1_41_8]